LAVARASPPASSGTVPVPGTPRSIAKASDGSVAVPVSGVGKTRGGTPLELAAGTAALRDSGGSHALTSSIIATWRSCRSGLPSSKPDRNCQLFRCDPSASPPLQLLAGEK
jgi:hypothetical protein